MIECKWNGRWRQAGLCNLIAIKQTTRHRCLLEAQSPAPTSNMAIAFLAGLDRHRLTLHNLTSTISTTPLSNAAHSRSSYPAALQTDLVHYKELFSKLRFSYLEQITKEAFLKAITSEPPVIVETEENDALERKLLSTKMELGSCKKEVETVLAALDNLSLRLASAFDRADVDINKLRDYPLESKTIKETIDHYEKTHDAKVELNLPLSDTSTYTSAIESELRMVETELANLTSAIVRKTRQMGILNRAISVNEVNKEGLEKGASEALKIRRGVQAAGEGERENTGHWYKSSHEVLSGMLEWT